MSVKYKNTFNKLTIIVRKDARTGNRLNHNWEVDIVESIGSKLLFFFILICSQKIDKGYVTLAKVINEGNKYPFFE